MPRDIPRGRRPRSADECRAKWQAIQEERVANPSRTKSLDRAEAMKVPELVRALKIMLEATGDEVFTDAITLVEAYGFKARGLIRGATEARLKSFGDVEFGYLRQIKWLTEHRKYLDSNGKVQHWNATEAARDLSVSHKIPGASFDRVVDGLVKKYKSWERAGFPGEEIDYDAGDLGYSIIVCPTKGQPLDLGWVRVPVEGLTVRATGFWRRRVKDGAVSMKRVP